MCRHLARLGAPTTLQALLFDPPHSLVEQAAAPRRQRYGRINADGFGAGWYASGLPAPVRFRRAQPIWSDRSFASLAPAVSASCVLAAVRSATVGYPVDESCAAPFTAGRWLFSHNGAVTDPVRLRRAATGALDRLDATERLDAADCRAPVDSALLFALALAAWCRGASVGDGLAEALRVAVAAGGGRLNLLATDGRTAAATAYGDSLVRRVDAEAVVVASEPYDDAPGWDPVPPGSLVAVGADGVAVHPLDLPPPADDDPSKEPR